VSRMIPPENNSFPTVFDVASCELEYHREHVPFNSIVKQSDLIDPALVFLGEILRAADSQSADPHSVATRLLRRSFMRKY
jgi:hypothetical protein